MTLIEVVVTVAIVATLTAAVAIYVVPILVRSKPDVTRTSLVSVANALDLYFAKHGRYPTQAEGLEVLLRERLIKGHADAWGNPFVYVVKDGEPEVLSYGADGAPGGAGDAADLSSRDGESAPK